MAIRVQCGCGKSFQVVDALAGKNARCPACSTMVAVPGSAGGAAGAGSAVATATKKGTKYNAATAAARKPVSATPAFAISPKAVIFICLLIAIPTLIFLAKIGPVKAMSQWKELEPLLNSYTNDVVLMVCKEQYKGLTYDEYTRPPKVTNVMIDTPVMMLTLPSEIAVQGTSTEGHYKGTYFPHEKRFELEIGVDHDYRVLKVKSHVDEKGAPVIDEEK